MGHQATNLPGSVTSSESTDLLGAIEARLGFVPPFFEPAIPHPDVLENLWHQTRTAYLDNPLPALFKEKIAAVLAGNCAVPYCLMCHSCALRPLGLPGDGIVRLLRMSRPTQAEVEASMVRLARLQHLAASGIAASVWEDDLLRLATAVYAGEKTAGAVRNALRHALDSEAYDNLVLFISYNKTCHDWMSAHPEVGYELDERYAGNYAPLIADTPEVADVLAWASRADPPSHVTDADAIAEARAAEVDRMAVLSEQRLAEVFTTMNKRLKGALHDIDEGNKLRAEVEQTSAFAQELLAIVSHDLRNPLGVIIAASGVLLRRHHQDAALADVLRRIVRSANRATHLVGELLDFSQARIGGGIPVVRQPGDIHDIVRHVVEEIENLQPGQSHLLGPLRLGGWCMGQRADRSGSEQSRRQRPRPTVRPSLASPCAAKAEPRRFDCHDRQPESRRPHPLRHRSEPVRALQARHQSHDSQEQERRPRALHRAADRQGSRRRHPCRFGCRRHRDHRHPAATCSPSVKQQHLAVLESDG